MTPKSKRARGDDDADPEAKKPEADAGETKAGETKAGEKKAEEKKARKKDAAPKVARKPRKKAQPAETAESAVSAEPTEPTERAEPAAAAAPEEEKGPEEGGDAVEAVPSDRTPADRTAPDRNPTERLHKFLASTGAGSRRECETFIATGRVTVNGVVVTKMGVKVDPFRDAVRLDGEPVKQEDRVYYLLHKPSGYICTNSDERGRPRAIDLIQDRRHRIYTVGRLDAESTGLILCTNDGAISNVLCHPRYRIEKVYQVAVRGDVTREEIAKIEAGVWLAEGRSSPAKVKPVGRNPRRDETILEMTIFEGRNREIRRVFAKIGLMVRRLTRVRIGPLEIGEIPPGAWQPLTEKDLEFVHDAERLYLANREAWDAELPTERKPKRAPGGHRPRPAGAKRRFDGPPRGPGGGARRFGDRPPPRGGARRFGDRPAQGDRRGGDRPFGDRPRGGDRPYGNRPFGDRPRTDRPYGDRPYGDRPGPDRPFRGDRPFPPRRPDGGRGPWRPSGGGYRGPRGPGGPMGPGSGGGPGGPRPDRPGGGRPFGGGGRGPGPDRPENR